MAALRTEPLSGGAAGIREFAMRVLLLVFALAAGCAQAEVFRCLTPEGKTLYSDSPCPRGSAAAEISRHVGECTDEQCQAERERQALAAQERLQRDKEALATMTAERRKAEADALAERIKLEELRRQAAIEERLAAEAEAAAQPGAYYPVYPWYPVTPCIGPCARPPVKPRPTDHRRPERPRERPLSLRDPPK
jgi:Domain of unknown function (DUF4124)